MPKIVVVDDDSHIRELVRLYLADEGYTINDKSNGADALAYLEICASLREFGEMPILMISAKREASDRIKGFKLGTDDYLVKPFDPVELVFRTKSLLKRFKLSATSLISIGSIVLDSKNYQVIFPDGKKTSLPLKEFELLSKLGSYSGQLFTRNNLIEQIWGLDYEGDERTVDVHIKRLRERFAAYESDFRIVTVRGLGYRLEVFAD
ncbi:response regulator transcription factor [Brevibacillus nitrificans]|uniref:response regulator transcription factor n=1 Tax=Brevibacillus nitrificans TaxID=651560 RepID=UPI00285DAD62|nr:response regulator transcription factor [Brevibacillus nitrificans]MDR7317555.1 DNA-binding response OmpR family regulator [Brevibacillus nitrificans]